MYLSKRSNGIYYLWYQDDSKRVKKISTHSSLKSLALEFARSFALERESSLARRRERTLSHFRDDFLAYARTNLSPGTAKIHRLTFQTLLVLVGDLPLTKITAEHVDRYKTERLHKISPVTVNIELRTLRSAFSTAVRWELISSNPFKKVSFASCPELPPRFFSHADFQKLISAVEEPWLKDLVLFATMTGMRRGELVNLRWDDVDLERRLVSIHSRPDFKTKMGKRRTIPLSDAAYQVLIKRRTLEAGDFVFTIGGTPISPSWVTHRFKHYVRRAKLPGALRFHHLRHTFASWLVQADTPIFAVQKLLGHSDIKVTQVYAHLQPATLHDTVNRISLNLN